MTYRLLKHKAYDESARRLPLSIQHKAAWAQVLLGIRGRTPSVKGTRGLNARWRRTPVQGNHYYMWWIPRSEGMIAGGEADESAPGQDTNTILIHSIRHHDETDEPIDPGTPADYEELTLLNLDPRYDEQLELSRRIAAEQVALATIKGLPGSGKTVSLLYLVKDMAQRPDLRKILYVTYSSRLKRAARDFLLAQDDAISQAVTIRTLGEIEHDLTGLSSAGEPFGELRDFARFVEAQTSAALGAWKRYPQTLYTEIRAHLLGRSFPASFTLPNDKLNALIGHGAANGATADAAAYAAARGLDLPAAAQVISVADRLRNGRFFQDQRGAQRAIELLQKGRIPGWLAELDALVVDEVQDLTLVQIGLLGELVRARMRRRPDAPFAFTVAGDESQIVQPSGFDWGITKELLGEQLGIWPEEFEFHYQRRSPRNLAQLIDNTWQLYGYLPKAQRPSARRQAFLYADDPQNGAEGHGRILVCPPLPLPERATASSEAGWLALLTELADKPGRVLIDLSDTLRQTLAGSLGADRDEVVFLAREIKGLERATVLVYGLNEVYARAMRLCNSHDDGNIPRFEARRLFDEIRVALSRSTEKIVLLEPADAPVLDELGFRQLAGAGALTWDGLLDTLQTEDMSEIELVEGYLDEADDLFERAMWAQGFRRNRRAYEVAVQLGDRALQREAQEQYIDGIVQEAAHWLRTGDWRQAYDRNREAQTLAETFGDPLLIDTVEEQFLEISGLIGRQIEQWLAQAEAQRQQHQPKAALDAMQQAAELATLAQDPALTARVDELHVLIAWEWAAALADSPYTPEEASLIADLLDAAAQTLTRQADEDGAQAAALVARRYRQISVRARLSESDVAALLTFGERYLALVKPLEMGRDAYRFVGLWLAEAFANLHLRANLYARWALLAQELALLDPTFDVDEPMWDLENRLNLLLERGEHTVEEADVARFQALVAAYNGDAQLAAQTWEQLGEPQVAAEFARDAGDLERAYRLLHQARLSIPEELATAVKAVRLLQQLHHKHAGLRPAERRALLAEMAALQAAVAAAPLPEDEGAQTAGG
ncbi:MAG: AAA family ATPase [Caldilineaceae bacterium]|nr:AAA family ATPase [Caldilineaceae bacterium]